MAASYIFKNRKINLIPLPLICGSRRVSSDRLILANTCGTLSELVALSVCILIVAIVARLLSQMTRLHIDCYLTNLLPLSTSG